MQNTLWGDCFYFLAAEPHRFFGACVWCPWDVLPVDVLPVDVLPVDVLPVGCIARRMYCP